MIHISLSYNSLYQCDGNKSMCKLGLEIYCFILTELQVIFFFLILLSIKYKMSCITTMILNRFWGWLFKRSISYVLGPKIAKNRLYILGKSAKMSSIFFVSTKFESHWVTFLTASQELVG